ncbi:MAG: YkgJ family cysteine cluster protein [Gemmataceae bacterium]
MAEPWYKDGLRFTCTRCGNCCTGAPGFVWVTPDEIAALAEYRGEPVPELTAMYTRRSHGKVTLREKSNGDCIFWDRTHGCTVYAVRPAQCRTWPFWESTTATPEEWAAIQPGCPGAGHGELITAEEITRRVRVVKV